MSVDFTVLIVLFVVTLVAGAPIAVAIGLPSAIYVLMHGWPAALILQRMFAGMDNFLLLAVPLFIFAGELMNAGGLTGRLVNFSQALVGHLRGSLAQVNLATNMMMAGISGSSLADASAVGTLLIPKMRERGYTAAFAAAVTAAGSIVGAIIPPSVSFILYAVLAKTSVIDLFLAGVMPGVLIIVLQMLMVRALANRRHFPDGTPFRFSNAVAAVVGAIPVLVLPFVIVGGIRVGMFTPIEGAAVAVVYAALLGLILRTLSLKAIHGAALQVGQGVGEILLMIAAASILSFILVAERVPQALAETVLGLTDSPVAILLLMNMLVLIVGMFLDGFAALVIFVPILLPLATTIGIDPVHFGVILVTNIMIGIITPPVGLCLFITAKIARVPLIEVIREIAVFVFVSILALGLITFIPAISLTLPQMFR
jgi:tripartite ATP-independent transporter DctM subunit